MFFLPKEDGWFQFALPNPQAMRRDCFEIPIGWFPSLVVFATITMWHLWNPQDGSVCDQAMFHDGYIDFTDVYSRSVTMNFKEVAPKLCKLVHDVYLCWLLVYDIL